MLEEEPPMSQSQAGKKAKFEDLLFLIYLELDNILLVDSIIYPGGDGTQSLSLTFASKNVILT